MAFLDLDDVGSEEPFGKPKGTVRAVLTLLIAVGTLGLQAYLTIHVSVDATIPLWLQIAFGSVVATYFVQRPGETKANETVAAVKQLDRKISGAARIAAADLMPGARAQAAMARTSEPPPMTPWGKAAAGIVVDPPEPVPLLDPECAAAGHGVVPTIVTADSVRRCGVCGKPCVQAAQSDEAGIVAEGSTA